MPKGGAAKTSKKAEQKAKERVIEDKTFGLKVREGKRREPLFFFEFFFLREKAHDHDHWDL
jgi:hypothetical protein